MEDIFQGRLEYLYNLYPVWERMTISQRLESTVSKYPERTYIYTSQQSYTYQETDKCMNHLAQGLVKLGIKRRDHVACLLPNSPEFIFSKFAVSKVGCVNVPLNFKAGTEELEYLLKQSDSKYLIMMDNFAGINYIDMLNEIDPDLLSKGKSAKLPMLCQVIIVSPNNRQYENTIDFCNLIEQGKTVGNQIKEMIQNIPHYPEEVSDILYTSGSTGKPKGAMLTHDTLLRSSFATCLSRAYEDGRRIYFPLPLHHSFSYVEGLLAALFVGGMVIPQAVFKPQETLILIEQSKATDMLIVPTIALALLNHPTIKDFDLTSLKSIMCASAPAPITLWKRLQEELYINELCTAYGMTEVSAASMHTAPGDSLEIITTTVGRIMPGGSSGLPEYGWRNTQYKVIDPFTGEDLPPGSEGELVCRGNILTIGYYKKPMETSGVIDKDGWLKTGDLGRIREDGYFELTGRSKELYIIGGENVAPKEVEIILSRHPKINQAYVVGVPDEKMGEVGMAFITIIDTERASEKEIREYCKEKLAKFKIPKYIKFISADEYPLTTTGKVQKFKLVEQAIEELKLQDVREKMTSNKRM
ncbi:AMP-binding protein [Peribacillus simplex]|uniref:AMP-binding protein n=1 Tax=Peribacillus simplex TaxID=1478 RepID=UPI001626F020|nr:AMP-binding protein [Peribacillus simplex]